MVIKTKDSFHFRVLQKILLKNCVRIKISKCVKKFLEIYTAEPTDFNGENHSALIWNKIPLATSCGTALFKHVSFTFTRALRFHFHEKKLKQIQSLNIFEFFGHKFLPTEGTLRFGFVRKIVGLKNCINLGIRPLRPRQLLFLQFHNTILFYFFIFFLTSIVRGY